MNRNMTKEKLEALRLKLSRNEPKLKIVENENPELNFVDLTGERFSSFEVLGLSKIKNKGGLNWVCQCACGRLEIRKTGTIRRHINNRHLIDSCSLCYVLRQLKNAEKDICK